MKADILIAALIVNSALYTSCGQQTKNREEENVRVTESEEICEEEAKGEGDEGDSNAIISDNNLMFAPLPASGIPRGFTSWAEIDEPGFEAKSLQILDGYDQVQQLLGETVPCSVYILAAYTNNEGQAVYVIKTSFKHVNDTHPHFKLVIPSSSDLVAKATDDLTQGQIYFRLTRPGDLLSADLMNLKWFHINHFDKGICTSLQVRRLP